MSAPPSGLNPAQQQAVLHGDGPVLVLAGAGSGKTRVLTARIAHLVHERGIDPSHIIAVTFTNKAAQEMKHRVETLVVEGAGAHEAREARESWIGTFHALCLSILRRYGARIGLRPGFLVYDTSDQLALVKQILREEAGDDDATARPTLSRISRAKNALESASAFAARSFAPDAKLTARVYARYDDALRAANAVDFDDLLVRTLELFREHPDVILRLAERCEHILVDEFQDTNRPQYLLVRALSSVHGNVFAVGDEDQSIYRFRGAEIRNILDFESDYKDAAVLKLEQNYRSTQTILDAAGGVIARNLGRKGKTLWTENARGEPIALFRAPDDRSEAAWVARRVRELEPEASLDQIAVLYRTNAQSRQFEEIFRRDHIPYHIVGSVQFYERKEIRDLLAYLKITASPQDDVSFRRVVNTPPRGIGDGTVKSLDEIARARSIALSEAADVAVLEALVPPKQARTLRAFLDLLRVLRERAASVPVAELLRGILREVEFQDYLDKTYPGQSADRMDNLRALVSAAVEYEGEDPSPSLSGFLERSALVSDADAVGKGPGVALMTIHCAKGLEFSAVFLPGLEENLFPHARSAASPDELEEERRLCYVAMTRARRRLMLSCAAHRLVQGVRMPNPPSRFLEEIPAALIEEAPPAQSDLIAERTARWSDSDIWKGSSAARAAARAGRTGPSAPRNPVLQKDPGDGFPVGARVVHPRFGDGQIVEREGTGKTLKLTIRFSDHGAKKILPAYTELLVQPTGTESR